MKTMLFGLGFSLCLVGNTFAMTCDPMEVPVKTKVDLKDVNGNIVVNGTLGCAQSATRDGKVRVVTTVLEVTDNAARSAVIQIEALPSEIVGR